MQCSDRESASSDEGIHEAIDTILAEDKREKLARKRKLAEREAAAAAAAKESEERDRSKRRNPSVECKKRHTGAERSRRFSLRVMEAMRALERRRERRSECPVSKSSATCEIVNYVDRNFRNDGDVDAQVRIALKRLACQGFVKCEGCDAYTLLAPFASQLGKAGKANFSHSTPDLTNCQRDSSRRNARSNRSTPRCNRGCQRNHSCNQTEESSEIDLSIPSSVEEDIFRRRIERDIESLQQRGPPDETEAENATMDVSCERRLRHPANEADRRNSEMHLEAANRPACGDEDRRQGKCQLNRSVAGSPRKRSPAREDDQIVGAIHNPAREIEAAIGLPEFADDGNDDYEPVDVPDEDEQLEEDDNDEGDDAGDEVEDDTVLQELKQNSDGRIAMDEDRDRELRRWIRNCRRECERRAREGQDRGDQK